MAKTISQTLREAAEEENGEYVGTATSLSVQMGDDTIMLDKIRNAMTQEFYGRDGRAYASADAIRKSISNIEWNFRDHWDFVSVRVGCGLGGLDWENIRALYEQSSLEWTIYYL